MDERLMMVCSTKQSASGRETDDGVFHQTECQQTSVSRDAVDQLVLLSRVAVFSGDVSLETCHHQVGEQVQPQEHQQRYLRSGEEGE